jgi:phosphatidylserine/phosphatidylglycerophosphate/cardiolipin synthase-like enzyme
MKRVSWSKPRRLSLPEFRTVLSSLLVLTIFLTSVGFVHAQTVTVLSVCFSPDGNCGAIVTFWISRANSTIHIEIYDFTLDQIGDSLVKAHQGNPNLDIKIVWEDSTVKGTGSEYEKLIAAGISIHIDTRSGLMHDKVAIIDGRIVLTGSFNWTNGANKTNRENLIVIDSSQIAAPYETNFQQNYAATA